MTLKADPLRGGDVRTACRKLTPTATDGYDPELPAAVCLLLTGAK